MRFRIIYCARFRPCEVPVVHSRIHRLSWLLLAGIAALVACTELNGEPPVFDGLHYPVSVAVTPDGNYLLVANSNFDLGKRHGSVAVVDLATRSFLPERGVSVGAFPGALTLGSGDIEDHPIAGYLPVREDNSLTWFQMSWAEDAPTLRCNDPDRPYQDRRCAGLYVVTEGLDDDGEDTSVGNDPYSSVYLPGRVGEPDHLVVGSLRSGSLDLFTIGEDGAPTLSDRLFLTQGINDLAIHEPSRTIFATAKYSAIVLRVTVKTDESGSTLTSAPPLSLPLATSSSDIGRSLAFTADGSRLLVAWRAPDALVVYDTTSQGSAESDVSLLALIPFGADPANLRIFPSGPDGSDRAYVISMGNNSLYVVDPASQAVEDRIRLGPSSQAPDLTGISPFSIAWSPVLMEAYVANFLGHSVSVVDLDPSSATYHTVIEEIR